MTSPWILSAAPQLPSHGLAPPSRAATCGTRLFPAWIGNPEGKLALKCDQEGGVKSREGTEVRDTQFFLGHVWE